MEKLYMKCRDIISSNTSCEDDEIIDYLTVAFMALYTLKGELILDKLPKIIKELEIERCDKTKVDLSIKVLCKDGEAQAQNILSFPNEIDPDSYYSTVESTLYFLTNLLRLKDIKNCGDYVEIKNGVSTKRVYLDGSVMLGRSDFLEKGITNITVKDAMISLREYLSDAYDDDIETQHYSDLVKDRCFIYDIRVFFIERLLEDDRFRELVSSTFLDTDERKFSKEYNTIMDNDAAYARLIKLFKDLSTAIFDNDESRIGSIAEIFCEEIDSFKKKNKQYKKD